MGKFLRNIKTGVVWGHTDLLAVHPDFVPHEADVKDMDESERAAIIVKAIKAIPREEWGTGGTMPLVGAVSEKAGFKVAAAEIREAIVNDVDGTFSE